MGLFHSEICLEILLTSEILSLNTQGANAYSKVCLDVTFYVLAGQLSQWGILAQTLYCQAFRRWCAWTDFAQTTQLNPDNRIDGIEPLRLYNPESANCVNRETEGSLTQQQTKTLANSNIGPPDSLKRLVDVD